MTQDIEKTEKKCSQTESISANKILHNPSLPPEQACIRKMYAYSVGPLEKERNAGVRKGGFASY